MSCVAARTDPPRQGDRLESGRPDPPPRAQTVAISESRRIHGGARTDVRGQHRREQQERTELAPRHKEPAGVTNTSPDQETGAHQDDGVRQQNHQVKVYHRSSADRSAVVASAVIVK